MVLCAVRLSYTICFIAIMGLREFWGGTWPTGTMAFWTTVMLGAVILLAYLSPAELSNPR